MRRIPTFFDLTFSIIPASFGLYFVYEGCVDKSGDGGGMVLIGGAVLLMLGILALVSTIRNYLWHLRMLRQSARNIPVGPDNE